MQRVLLGIIVVLAAMLLAREPSVARADDFFLGWLLRNTAPHAGPVPLLIVEINPVGPEGQEIHGGRPTSAGFSPLEFALFLQAILEFKPAAVAFEPLLQWRQGQRDQEQIFIDQAMRIPKLLLASELTDSPDPDAPPTEILGFTHVKGRRGDLPTFNGIVHQPDEDLRLISTPAYTNLTEDAPIRVPLLFQYRSEIIPAFALQAYMTWARLALSEVSIELGSHIALPNGRKIPIASDGSILVNPNAGALGRTLSLNELLDSAQRRPKDSPMENLGAKLVLARTPLHPMTPPAAFAAAIATLQSNHFVRRVGVVFDCLILLAIAVLSWFATEASRLDVLLGVIGFTAIYCLLSLGLLSRYEIWLPTLVPLATGWLLGILALIWPRPRKHA